MAKESVVDNREQNPARRLSSLTGLRFLAALYVVATHICVSRSNPAGLADFGSLVGRFAALGYLGVTFFFVLSGFVLTWSAPGDAGVDVWAFYRRRFARVYPLHFITTLAVGAGIIATGGVVATGAWPLCLLLMQAWVPDSASYFALNPVSWSLSCEAFFYAVTPFLLGWFGKRSSTSCVAVASCLVAAMACVTAVLLLVAPQRDQDVWFSPWFSLGTFTAGMALALVLRRGQRRWPSRAVAVMLLMGTLLLLIALSWQAEISRTEATVLVLPAVVILIGAVALGDIRGDSGWLSRRWMVQLGEWSFALYLIHKMTINLLVDLLKLPKGIPCALLAVVLSISASGALYHLCEKPIERLLRPKKCIAVRVEIGLQVGRRRAREVSVRRATVDAPTSGQEARRA